MIKDKLLQFFCIPALGIVIPYFTGIITYQKYTALEKTAASLYFIFLSYSIWVGAKWIHSRFRNFYTIHQSPYIKLISITIISCLYSAILAAVFCFLWMHFSKEIFDGDLIFLSVILIGIAVLFFTLIYEVLYLSKEREIDNKIVDHLDEELTHAEMAALRNELDPHFIFNSLNTLSNLISSDPIKANLFNSNLAEIYKYFLINKENDLIALNKEIEFIKKYFFLFQIRHDNKIKLHIDVRQEDTKNILIIPCALQMLVENAMKHNEFTTTNPLNIFITTDSKYLIIYNNIKPKFTAPYSIKIGLKNLRSQYMVITKKKIIIEMCENKFVVKLPIINIHTKTHNDNCDYYRRRIISTGKTINHITESLP